MSAYREVGIIPRTDATVATSDRLEYGVEYWRKIVVNILINEQTNFEHVNVANLENVQVPMQGISRITPVFMCHSFQYSVLEDLQWLQ